MANLLIDYQFDALNGSNPDASFPFSFSNGNIVNGPGQTSIGTFSKALNLGTNGKAKINIASLAMNLRKFCFQFTFKAKGPVSGRQNLFESNKLPFSIHISKGKSNTFYELNCAVAPKKHGWGGTSTLFKKSIRANQWLTATVAYDVDTLALFIDDELIGVHAFPNGIITKSRSNDLFIGTWVDGRRNHFKGDLAAFKWWDGIPGNFESLLDEQRTQAEWFISYKQESIKSKLNFGKKTQGKQFVSATGAHIQHFQNGAIMYHDSLGAAFEMHGAIYQKYKAFGSRNNLGYLVTDESNSTRRGGKKSIFSKGGIYWSSASGARVVSGEIYLEYENFGEAAKLGFPTQEARNISGGKEQIFQFGRMYYKNGEPNANEVHGAILARFLALGGTRKMGFPTSNEMDVKNNRRQNIGKCSEFETCTIYWKSGVGAFEVHGDIRKHYRKLKGPAGSLGFPTSNEVDIPGVAGHGRMNTFEKGSILWYGSAGSIRVARPFKIFIGRINSRENEGFGMGQNDLYFKHIRVKEGSRTLYNKRRPSSGDWSGNVKDVNFTIPITITPNKINTNIKFEVKIMDADPGTDDHLGTKSWTLSAANAWGLRNNNGLFNEAFSKIRSFTWSVKPQVNLSSLTEVQKWWGEDNFKTAKLTWQQAAAAFRDLDSDTEWWDVSDWLQKAFFELVAEGIAKDGNCFGMALEAIYAKKNISLFGQPLNEKIPFNRIIKNEINIKHAYQVGAAPIWWFLGQFVSGNTHDPKDVFNRSHAAFLRGDDPVICIAQNYDFSGGPHCILPVDWRKTSSSWIMKVMDPNKENQVRTLTVNPRNNTFRYQGSSRLYTGGQWSGGRFHYMPFCILNRPPRTPVWDAILLLLTGTVIILADDAETVSIKDLNGKDLNAHGNRAKTLLKSGKKPDEYFVNYQGFDRSSSIKPGQIMMRRDHIFSQSIDPGISVPSTGPLTAVIADRRFRTLGSAVNINANPSLAGRNAHHILADPNALAKLTTAAKKQLQGITKINNKRNFVQVVKGRKAGKLKYVVKNQLSEIRVESTLRQNEVHNFTLKDLGTHQNVLNMDTSRNKNANIVISNKLGVQGDFIEMTIQNVPLKTNKPLQLNIKKGIAGMEIVNQGVNATLPIAIKAKINGKTMAKNFTLPFANGARIKPASMLENNHLEVSKIDNLFGQIKSSLSIKKR